jgi:hypothetical protein
MEHSQRRHHDISAYASRQAAPGSGMSVPVEAP